MIIPAIGIGPLGAGEWSVGGVSGLGASGATAGAAAAPASGTGSFSNALTSAIGSLETTQANATQAAQGLATGQLSDPTKAITAVENANLAMDFAAQMRNQIDAAATTIFQTQV